MISGELDIPGPRGSIPETLPGQGKHARADTRAGTRIRGLDGLRAFAIVSVLLFHFDPSLLPGGFLGVDVFFVVSGFLITTLLLREIRRSAGRIDLVRFWKRRARRLLPALFTVVIVTLPVAWFLSLVTPTGADLLVNIGRQVLGTVTFANNWAEISAGSSYFNGTSPLLFVNFWSLAVEEQFYLLWPLVLLALLRFVRSTRARIAVVLGIAAVSAVAMGALFTPGTDATRVYYGTDTHLFGLMIGVALAFATTAGAGFADSPWWRRHGALIGALALSVLVIMMTAVGEDDAATFRGGILFASVLTAVAIAALIGDETRLSRILELRALTWIGRRSYAIYMWHWPLMLMATTLWPTSPSWAWLPRLFAVIATVLAAAVSLRWIETPIRDRGFRQAFTDVRRRIAVPANGRPGATRAAAGLATGLVALSVVAMVSAPTMSLVEQQIAAAESEMDSGSSGAITMAAGSRGEVPVPAPASTDPVNFAVPSGDELTAFGDSLVVTSLDGLKAAFPGIAADAKSNRQWPAGADAVQDKLAQGAVRRAVLLDLGTNGGVNDPDVVRTTLAALTPGRTVVVVNLYGHSEWIPQANATLAEQVSHYPNAIIADWHAAASAHPELLQSDGVHPGIEGAHLYASVVRAAFETLAARSPS